MGGPWLPLRLNLDTLLLLCTMPTPTGLDIPPPIPPPPVLDAVERGPLMLMLIPTMATMAMLPSTEASTLELLVTPPEPPMLPDLSRELARGLLMLMPMLTTDILMLMDMDTLMPMDTDLMDTLMVMPDGKQRL